MVADPKFRELVRQDADCIVDRQATDTIDVVDEIRFVLRSATVTGTSDIWQVKGKIHLLDTMLEEMGLEVFN